RCGWQGSTKVNVTAIQGDDSLTGTTMVPVFGVTIDEPGDVQIGKLLFWSDVPGWRSPTRGRYVASTFGGLYEQIGVKGFEPSTSWSRTTRNRATKQQKKP